VATLCVSPVDELPKSRVGVVTYRWDVTLLSGVVLTVSVADPGVSVTSYVLDSSPVTVELRSESLALEPVAAVSSAALLVLVEVSVSVIIVGVAELVDTETHTLKSAIIIRSSSLKSFTSLFCTLS
jgi:hypothetical protein